MNPRTGLDAKQKRYPLNLPGIDPRFSCRPLLQEIQTKTFVRISCISCRQVNNHPGDIRLRADTPTSSCLHLPANPEPDKVSKYGPTSLADIADVAVVRSRKNPPSVSAAWLELLYQYIFSELLVLSSIGPTIYLSLIFTSVIDLQ
jgi:hypothetical protein